MASNSTPAPKGKKRGPTAPVADRGVTLIGRMGVADINTFAGGLVKNDRITAEYLHTQLTAALNPANKEA